MKSLLPTLAAALFLGGCAATQPSRPTDPAKQIAFDLTHPGGPVFQSREYAVTEAPPSDPPFGKFFSNDRPDNPPPMHDPYWITGGYAWVGNQWEWVEGRWVERPRPGLIWINARYIGGSPQIWQTGYWQ